MSLPPGVPAPTRPDPPRSDPVVPGVRSSLGLRFHAEDHPAGARPRLTLTAQDPPQRVVRAFVNDHGAAVAHLHNLSGGVLGGDQLSLDIQAASGVQAQVTTTGATRVYRHRPGADAAQQTTIRVGAGAQLAYLPDLLIPFATARYAQQTRIDLDEGAGLVYWEMLAPGRAAAGEVFAYARVTLRLELYAAGMPLALETLDLAPAQTDLRSPARFGPYAYLATLYLCRVGQPAAVWRTLEAQLAELAAARSHPGAVLWGVSTLPAHGLVARGLSVTGQSLPADLVAFWDAASQALDGRPARPPRKLY